MGRTRQGASLMNSRQSPPLVNCSYTDPESTLGWGIVDFDWSNGKGTGTADGWAKHKPMDDEEMLFKQVQITANATPGTTTWIYRNTVYAYPCTGLARRDARGHAHTRKHLLAREHGRMHVPERRTPTYHAHARTQALPPCRLSTRTHARTTTLPARAPRPAPPRCRVHFRAKDARGSRVCAVVL